MANNLPIKASTQDHLDVEDIIDDLVLLKDGTAALILETTALNFGLLSEPEQDAVIYSYAGLLNSLTFSIEVLIRSKRSDVSEYLQKLVEAEKAQINQDLKTQIKKYREFIEATVQKNEVLEKKFYLVIPFTMLQVGARGTMVGIGKKQKGTFFSKKYILQQAKNELVPKRDNLIKQLARVGLKSHQLENHELIELLYDIYNPQEVGLQKITPEAGSYTSPFVQPSITGQIEPVTPKSVPTPQLPVEPIPQSEPISQPEIVTQPQVPIMEQSDQPLLQPNNPPPSQPISAPPQPALAQDQKQVLDELQNVVAKANNILKKQN